MIPVHHSPPLRGYDEHLQPVTDDGEAVQADLNLTPLAPTSRRSRSRLGAVGTYSRPLSRGAPVSPRSRPQRFQSAAGRLSRTPPHRSRTRSSGPPLNSSLAFSPASLTSEGLGDWNISGNTSSSTNFEISIATINDNQSDSSGTLVPGSNEISEDEEILLSPTAREIIAEINAMPPGLTAEMERAAGIREHRKILNKACTIWEEEYINLSPADAPIEEIKSAVSIAKEWKEKILDSRAECEDIPDTLDLRKRAGLARTGFIKYISDANLELRTLENKAAERATSPQFNTSNTSESNGNKAKADRVASNSDSAIGQMQSLADEILRITLEPPQNQLEFRGFQENVKSTREEVTIVKQNAKVLIDLAYECDLGEEGGKLETAYKVMEGRERDLIRALREHRANYAVLADSKSTDIKPPTFSGEPGDRLDFYSFKEDWDNYVSVKGPSNAEQLRILTKQSLTGVARAATKHMEKIEDIFDHLKESFGNASDLFSRRVEDIRKLGICKGSNEQKRRWAVEVRAHLINLVDLSKKHEKYEDLYTHQIVAEVQESLHPDVYKDFYKLVRAYDGVATKRVVFELLVDYMDEVVDLFNHQHAYRLDFGVDPDKYYKSKFETKKTAPPPTKPTPKSKSYTTTSVAPSPGSGSSGVSGKPGKGRNKSKGNSVFVSSSYTPPALRPCKVCSGQHTHVFYCEKYIESDILVDRFKLAQRFRACFRCLRMDSDINLGDRAKWEAAHDVNCQSEWVCETQQCGSRPKNRQWHFTLCAWHVEDNQKRQNNFIKNLDQSQIKPGTSFFFNTPTCYAVNSVSKTTPRLHHNSDPQSKILDDYDNPSIFMLQEYKVNDRKALMFYDSGCMGAAVSNRGAALLDSICVRPGPTTMNVAGGKTFEIEGGDEEFLLDLVANKTKATVTALRMSHITTKFPVWNISQAWSEIQKDFAALMPGKLLPPTPPSIGGEEVDIMIGIRYISYFPTLICILPCGLGIYRSKITAPQGEVTILGGPHPAWRHASNLVGVLGLSSFFTAEFRAYQAVTSIVDNLPLPLEHEPVELLEDVVDADLLLPDDDIFDSCSAQHCDKHGDLDEWIIPNSWNIEDSTYSLRREFTRFEDAEHLGSEVSYRCVRCRNCNNCKKGESLESASLKEEQEQYLIDQSVSFDPDGGFMIAKLPFTADPKSHLQPNRYQAEKILDSQLRQLSKNGSARLDVLAAHEKLTSGGYVLPLSALSLGEKKLVEDDFDSGYFIPWRAVWKSASLSTPCRMVFDASSKTPGGESLNAILAKGKNKLAQIPNLINNFRAAEGGFTCDLKMAYNQIRLDPSCYRYQKYLWKDDLDHSQPVKIMIVRTLIYGVKSSGNQLFSGLSEVADYCEAHFPEHQAGAQVLREDGYVDDIIHSDSTPEIARSTAASLDFVINKAQLSVKAYTFAGSPPSPEVSKDGVHVGLVGLLWNPEDDLLGLDIKELYFGKARRGVLPEPVSGNIGESLRKNFTRRNMLGKVAGVYDPTGLATAVTSRLKLDLHDLCLENLGWDDQIPDSYLERWLVNLDDIQALREIRFRRTIIPPDAASLDLDLIVSSDASKSIAIASVHARVLLTSGMYSCQLLTAKSKIVRYNTIPRAELRAAVVSASLAHSVKHNLRSRITNSLYVSDSTIILHWLNQDERPLETAVRNSVIEIRRLSDVRQWFHIDGTLNIADLGTRDASVSDISLGSEWQDGKPWMTLPRSQMPLKTIEEIDLSSEERRIASQELRSSVLYNDLPEIIPRVSERYKFSKYLYDPNKSPWSSSVRILSYVLRFLRSCKPRWSPPWFPAPAPTDPIMSTYPFLRSDRPNLSDIDLRRGENYYFYKATLEVIKFSPDKEYKDTYIIKNKIYHYVGRILDSQEILSPEESMLDLTPLSFVRPIVDRFSPVAYSIMIHCHETISHHRSATSSLLETRYIAFILRARDLASEVARCCRFCIRYKAKLIEVEMGKLHPSRLTIAPVFYCSQVDLFGPYTAICEHQHRSTVKMYGVVFKCPATCAIAIYTMQNYTTAAFLQAYTRFASRYGHPTELRIDEGSQLLSACKNAELSIMDITNFLEIQHQVGVKHSTCAVASHNAHGMVERSIREIKNLLNKVYKGLRLDIMSFETCLSWISSELNNLPICLGSRINNLDHVDLITPSRLILGRNNRRALSGYARISTPSRLISQMDDVYDSWWKVWRTEKLLDFIPQPSKWKKTNEQLRESDIVIFLKSDSEKHLGEPVWRIARVKSINVSEDGLVRTAVLEYRNPSEKTLRTTNRSARSVVVIHREGDLDVLQSLEQAARDAEKISISGSVDEN